MSDPLTTSGLSNRHSVETTLTYQSQLFSALARLHACGLVIRGRASLEHLAGLDRPCRDGDNPAITIAAFLERIRRRSGQLGIEIALDRCLFDEARMVATLTELGVAPQHSRQFVSSLKDETLPEVV